MEKIFYLLWHLIRTSYY